MESENYKAVTSLNMEVSDILCSAQMGVWNIIVDEGKPKFIVEKVTADLVGITDLGLTPEEAFEFWFLRVPEEYAEDVQKCLEKMLSGEQAEVTYTYNHPFRGPIGIRCGGLLDTTYKGPGKCMRGYHQEITRFREDLRRKESQNKEFIQYLNELSNSGMWYIYFTKEGKVESVVWTRTFREMLGFENEFDFPNTTDAFLERLHPEDKERVLLEIENAINGVINYNTEYRMMKKNGTYEWFCSRGKCVCHENGNPRLFFGVFINITEKKQNEEDLNSRMDAFLGGIKGGLKISRNELHFPYHFVSEAVAALQGYTPEELIKASGGTAVGNAHPEDIAAIAVSMRTSFKKTGTYSAKYRVRHKDGHWLWIYDYGKKVVAPDGNEYVYSLIQDIDEQELLNHKLKIERKSYQNALTKNADFHFNIDLTDGYFRKEIKTKDGRNFFESSGLKLPLHYDHLIEFMRGFGYVATDDLGEKSFSRKALLKLHEDGMTQGEYHLYNAKQDYYVRMLILMYRNDENKHVYANLIQYNETEKKKNEIAQQLLLKTALSEAEKANTAKTVFLNNMSHDIRTPMNAIIGFADLASSHLDEKEKVKDYLDKIKTSSDHLLSLINDVLDMSRIESGKVKIEASEVNLPEVIEDLESIVQADVRGKNLVFSVLADGITDGKVLCDKLRLKQVLLNCLSNSIKFTPERGEVKFQVAQLPSDSKDKVTFEFRIKDSGIGMSQEFAEHLFEPFSREETSTVSGIQGTGLGMSITKGIVDLMNGTIKVSSEKGKGTEFIILFSFPRVKKNIKSSRKVPKREFTSLKGTSILLVEDNQFNRELAVETLMDMGAIVETAEDGSVALEKITAEDSGKYDVVLMDIQMPVMDGYEATKKIRSLKNKKKAALPIIAMTANAFEEDRKLALQAGMDAHMAKPIQFDMLFEVMDSILKGRKN